MAEVGQRLSGVCRLSALRSGRVRPVRTGESPGCMPGKSPGSMPGHSALTDGLAEAETAANIRQFQLKNGAKQDTSEKIGRGRKSEHVSSSCFSFMDFDSSDSNGSVKSRGSLQATFLQEELLPLRMSSWSRRVSSVHPETLRSPQQLRAFCTVTFVLAELRSERSRLRRLKVRPGALWSSSTTRCYTKDAPPLHRSRTAYYDVLRVSPAATQSQIKTAYYKQSLIYHPDKNLGSEEATKRFSEISEAYTVLGNIGLRRKYDRGILSQSDLQGAGRPSSRPTASTQHQHRARRFSQSGGKTMFDFDAFYQAHYGEQLQREQAMRARKQRLEEEQKKNYERWRKGKMMEVTVAMLLALAGAILFNLSRH